MATNDILKFGDDASNILGQSAYAADTDRTEGVSGKARSNLQNKFQRQMSVAAAGLSQFIADYNSGDDDVVDTLSAVEYAALLLDALSNAPLTTQPQFDNSQKAATTGFVQRALGSLASTTSYAVNTNLTAADIGKTIIPTTGGLAFGLPLVAGLPNGAQIRFNGNGHGCAIARQGSDVINNGSAGSISSVSVLEYDVIEFTVIYGLWYVTGGNEQLNTSTQFKQSLITASGYKDLPGGFILNWAQGQSDASGILTATWAKPFTTEVVIGWANEYNPVGWAANSCTVWGFSHSESTLTTAVARVRNIVGTSAPVAQVGINGSIFAIGY